MQTYEERIALIKAIEAKIAARRHVADAFIPNMDRPLMLPGYWERWREIIHHNHCRQRAPLFGIQLD